MRLYGTLWRLLPTPSSSFGAASPQSTLWPGGWPRAHHVASVLHHASVLACTQPINLPIQSPTHYPLRNLPNPPPCRSASQLSKTAWNYGAIPIVFIFMYAFRGVCLLALNPIFKLLGTSESGWGGSQRAGCNSLDRPAGRKQQSPSCRDHSTASPLHTPLLQSCPCLTLHL